MKESFINQSDQLKRFALLPARLLWWTANGQLREKLKVSRDYKLVASSGLFDAGFYLEQMPSDPSAETDPLRHYLTVGGFNGCMPNYLFDSAWYLSQNPDVAANGINPLVHFLRGGWKEGRNPHPLFDVRYYLQNNSDVAQSGANPLAHYLQTGANEPARHPHVLFDNSWYLDQNLDVAQARQNPLVHYLATGWHEGRSPHPLFDVAYYLEHNPDIAQARTNPLLHFLSQGFKENRNPNPLFDCSFYRATYPDIGSSSANPLIHYLSSGDAEGRLPHPLFDPGFYGHREPVSPGSRTNSLAHYLHRGRKEHLSIHPLFNVDWYLAQHPELASAAPDPVRHYLEEGWQLGFDPSELFDTSYYLNQYPEIAEASQNPLIHYILKGASTGYNPNPLFESAYYLKQYPDIAAIGQNPLTHYIVSGAWEGRSPSPFFDSLFYLRRNPGLRRANTNPLAHYLASGAEDGKDPSPFFSTSAYLKDHPEVRELRINPLVHYLGIKVETPNESKESAPAIPAPAPKITFRIANLDYGAAGERTANTDKRDSTVICVSHVSPYPPRAGNEYRIHRMLQWLRANDFRVVPILSPLAQDGISDAQVVALANEFGNSLLCNRDGRLACCLSDPDLGWVSAFNGTISPSYGPLLDEDKPLSPRALHLLNIDRSFCHDALVHVVAELALRIKRCVVIAEYIFMSRLLPLLPRETLKVIDTHDVFSSKRDKVVAYGLSDDLSLTKLEEAERLVRANLILAIQPEERQALEKLSSPAKVITVGVDFSVSEGVNESIGRQILYVASDNAMNAKGLRDFLRFAWPAIRSRVPDAQLLVAGNVSSSVRLEHPGVELLGPVDNLEALYQNAKLAINPALAGTGLKIKTLEALSYFRPLVTWPAGVEGLDPELASLCCVVRDWFEFHQQVTRILLDSRATWYSPPEQSNIRRLLSPANVYRSLTQELSTFFQNARVAAV